MNGLDRAAITIGASWTLAKDILNLCGVLAREESNLSI